MDERAAGLGHTRPDLDRPRRTGLPEAVYAAGKSPEQCVEIVAHHLSTADGPVIVTRADEPHRAALRALRPAAERGTTLTWRHDPEVPHREVAVVCGGTSDLPVVEECRATLAAHGVRTRGVTDVGVAGLHRLLGEVDGLADAAVIVAVAGMEASLPTVLAGLVRPPVIAVPTSTGYGTSFEGMTALLSVLASCAPGVTAVGIDNGYGAACAALRILGGHR